jgi:putative dehydrogenase
MTLARRSGLDLELVQQTLDNSIGASAIWNSAVRSCGSERGRRLPGRSTPCIPSSSRSRSARPASAPPVFIAANAVFDRAVDDGWGELDIACVHDQLSGESTRTQGEPA